MGSPNEQRLAERLERVVALEQGATTPGERTAAKAARERLVQRLAKVQEQDPVRRFVRAHVAALGVEGRMPEPPASLPGEQEIVGMLLRWSAGEVSRIDVEDWAEQIVDRLWLPTDPNHEEAAIAEVLLQLAMLHRVALDVRDVDAIRAFLAGRDWEAWFEVVAAAAKRRRPVG